MPRLLGAQLNYLAVDSMSEHQSSIYQPPSGQTVAQPKDEMVDSTAELNSLQCNAQELTKYSMCN